MKRVDIQYGGDHYSIAGRELDDVKREIADGFETGSIFWLSVNSGEGQLRPAEIALSPGVSIAISAAHDE
jgi:hypothetical protein